MAGNKSFCPDWASPPGDTIVDVLQERGVSIAEFADQIGQPRRNVGDLLDGRTAITISLARQLHQVLGASVEFWMARDLQYREDIERRNSLVASNARNTT